MFNINKFEDVFIENWKAHSEAPIPAFDDEKINIYEFNHNRYEPLRTKWTNITIIDNTIKIYWECQESFDKDELSGMKKEIKRWAKYWLDIFNHSYSDSEDNYKDFDSLIFKVTVADRDGISKESFSFKLNL